MSGAQTQSEGGALAGFLHLRASLRASRIGRGGRDVCRSLSSSLDAALAELACDLASGRVAVVAIGGYGRSELSPFSDVDIMVLHEREDPAGAAAAMFRPLWDAGLRLGHAVRTVEEASRAARDRFDTFTTLLTGRLVAGDEDLFARFSGEISSLTRARPLRRYVVADEVERRRRSPYLEMAVNVKSGRGGLRTLHGFEWERRREALIGRFSAGTDADEEVAGETLLRIRNALHVVTGRPHDVFSHDLREPVARWLDMDVFGLSRELVRAMQTVDHLAGLRWPELTGSGDSLPARLWNRVTGGRDRGGEGIASAPELADLLRGGQEGRLTWERMRRSGHLADLLPEWDQVRVTPQLAPFHEHPVEAHLWRTVDEMQALIDGDDHHFSAMAEEVDSPDALTFAAFLHDIGKDRGGDHSAVGAGIAAAFCRRIGCSPGVVALVADAVRHHLLLAETATRRDLDDPSVVAEVAETVGDLRLLQVLYLLTVADSRATGSGMWNEWKATLVRTLFFRCAACLGARSSAESTPASSSGVVASRPVSPPEWESHLAQMPPEYTRGTPVDEIRWHLDLIDRLEARSQLGVRPEDVPTTAALVGLHRPGFHRVAAECFAANGIDVQEARLAVRSDGMVIDSFRVRDDRTGGPVPSARWDRVRADLEAALAGELDTASKLAARAEAYASVAPATVPLEVRVSVDPASEAGVITVRCSDRIGRLAQVLSILCDRGLDIRLAKIDSRGGEVIDTFHVPQAALPDVHSFPRLERLVADAVDP